MNDLSLYESIEEMRRKLGKRVSIVGHHYQDDSVIRHTDLRGDSLELARKIAHIDSEYIIFCGVYFMAESAALLARPDQTVFLPEPSAECVMAKMSPAVLLEKVMQKLSATGRKIVPVTYVNSTLEVKAFVGKHNGSVCTSANAEKILTWALEQGDAVFFVPDRNLGTNTSEKLGVGPEDRLLLDISGGGARIDMEKANKARVLLWPGCCPIHTRFTVRQINRLREEYPGLRVVVHPECNPDVVKAADAAGSTSFIINYVKNAEKGAFIAIGTEIHLVERLAAEYANSLTIMPLVESECTHMSKTTEERVHAVLQDILAGGSNFVVRAPLELQDNARNALETMLRVCS